MDYKDYVKRAEEEIKEPPGPRREALVHLTATAEQINDTYSRLLADTDTCADCRLLGFYCEPCSIRLSKAKYRMHEAEWELNLMLSPPPTDETEYREWLNNERHALILISNRLGTPHGTPRDFLNSYPVQWIDTELSLLDQGLDPAAPNLDRILWTDTASRLAHLVHELAAAGYITPPQRMGKPNWSAVARTLHAAFDIRSKEGSDPVTLAALTQALKPEGDRDIIGGKAAFKITPRQG